MLTAKNCLLLQNFNILGPSTVDVTPYFGKKTPFLPKSLILLAKCTLCDLLILQIVNNWFREYFGRSKSVKFGKQSVVRRAVGVNLKT